MGKLAAWSRQEAPAPARVDELGPNVWRANKAVEERGLKIVGTPFGSKEYIKASGTKMVEEELQLLDKLPKLSLLQSSWLLLYFCAVPRINHLLRTVPPTLVRDIAEMHDDRVQSTFRDMFQISGGDAWDFQLHGVSHPMCMRQAKLPLRMGGCGLRDSQRTSFAAYWASWADSIGVLHQRFPEVAQQMVDSLESIEGPNDWHRVPFCMAYAEAAGRKCTAEGFNFRPTWRELRDGLRPPQPESEEVSLGEWAHGWQYHASNALETAELKMLLSSFALPNRRSNARAAGKARVHSCKGPFAASWLTTCPKGEQLTFADEEMMCCMRRRLGLAVVIDGPDTHGHRRLADNTGARLNTRHTMLVAAWRQVFYEAGGQVPDRNVERLLSDTHVPVDPADLRRLDLVVPGLNVARGLPLFCDVTIISPLSRNGQPRGGTSNQGGRILADAE
eukprot:1905086-Karenia_brevis.AAC.1